MSKYHTKVLTLTLSALLAAGSAIAADKSAPQKDEKQPSASRLFVHSAEGLSEVVGAPALLLGSSDISGGMINKGGLRGAFMSEQEKVEIRNAEDKIIDKDSFVGDSEFKLRHQIESGYPSKLTPAEVAAKRREIAVAKAELKELRKRFFKKYAGRILYQASILAAVPITLLDGFLRFEFALQGHTESLIPGSDLVGVFRPVADQKDKKEKISDVGQPSWPASEQSSKAEAAK